jgi:two-component system OmpR family sensor kinase/two-component system sensor histidine kinase BaeS
MRLKLFLSYLVIVIVSVSLVAVIARRGAVNEVRLFMFRGGMYGLSDLASGLENYYQINGTWQGVQSIFNSAHPGMQGMGGMMNQRLSLADASGSVILDTRSMDIGNKLTQAELAVAIPLKIDGQTVGYLITAGGMGYAMGSEQALLSRLNRGVLLAGLLAGALGLALAFGLAYTLLRPVRDLTLAAQKLSEGDLTQSVVIHGDDELATLGHAFNQMADSLQQAEESRRLMTADIAHELRTPLAVQRANLEALQDGVYPLTVENLAPVIEQNHLLTHLVEDLRTLALADAGQIELERTPTDLVSLVEQMQERFKPQAAMHQARLVFSPPATSIPPLSLDPIRLEQMLTNLLSNALRFTPQDGQIEVAITELPKVARLTVHDTGPGIPEEALPFIFERFYRADKSRSRIEGGSGLGLAIARNLARAHGGDLTATNHASGGALFTLTLPLDIVNQYLGSSSRLKIQSGSM